jgi:ABC-type Fe3+-hydroxamate transport system substrate-binding protein
MPSFTDQLGRSIALEHPPQRIISLVPSQTELLYGLGLGTEVAGITKFCVHPRSWFESKKRIGGTKSVNMDTVRQLQPDLIIANKEENVKEQVEELSSLFPTWISDITRLEDALNMITSVGEITGKASEATSIANNIAVNFSRLTSDASRLRTCYLIWNSPLMTVGGDTFISDMLSRCGLQNIFEQQQRYPVTTVEELKTMNCELLLLSSEPFPFKQKHIDLFRQQLPHTRILLVDGEMFSWYGSRLLHAPDYFHEIIKAVIA